MLKDYHVYFYVLKFIILLLISLMSLKIINIRENIYIFIDFKQCY